MQGTRTDENRIGYLPFLIFFGILLLDQLTKWTIVILSREYGISNVTVIENFFELSYVTNSGAAFSFLSDKPWSQYFFIALTVVALVMFAFFFLHEQKKSRWIRYGLVFVIGGTVGNFIDRVYYSITAPKGYVVDFLSFNFGKLGRFATFNFADAFLCVGVLMVIIHYLFVDKDAVFRKKDDGKNNG